MSGLPDTSADKYIEKLLDECLEGIETAFESDAISIVGPLVFGVDDLVRSMIEDLRRRPTRRQRLAVLLTTEGGYLEPVQRIVDTMRHFYDHVGFIVPNCAYSAGTVLAMSGDEIYMDYYSRLGPIDPQVPTRQGRMVPALGYLIQWERLLARAQSGTLTLAEVQLMIEGFDQAELYHYEQARELSVTLLVQWLVQYKFKNWSRTQTRGKKVTASARRKRAEEIARMLNDTARWHSHGYGISMAVLQKDVGLLIEDLDDNADRCLQVRHYDGLLSDYMGKRGREGLLHIVGRHQPYRS